MFSPTFQRRFLKAAFGGENGHRFGAELIFNAIFSDDPEDLDDAVDYVEHTKGWPEEFKKSLENLHEFRESYAEKADTMTEEERAVLERYDDALAFELAEQLDVVDPELRISGDFPPEPAPR